MEIKLLRNLDSTGHIERVMSQFHYKIKYLQYTRTYILHCYLNIYWKFLDINFKKYNFFKVLLGDSWWGTWGTTFESFRSSSIISVVWHHETKQPVQVSGKMMWLRSLKGWSPNSASYYRQVTNLFEPPFHHK